MELSAAIALISNDHLWPQGKAAWADLGCGNGLFAFALASLLAPGSTIYAVDKNVVRLDPSLPIKDVEIKTLKLDFVSAELPLKRLDGILMANSLHYVQDKLALIQKLSDCLQPNGRFLIVEYDTDTPVTHWVPYPVSFHSLQSLFADAGFTNVHRLGEDVWSAGLQIEYAAACHGGLNWASALLGFQKLNIFVGIKRKK